MALLIAPASVGAPMGFLRLPVIVLMGMRLYAEPLDPWVLVGRTIIFAANWLNISAKKRVRYDT